MTQKKSKGIIKTIVACTLVFALCVGGGSYLTSFAGTGQLSAQGDSWVTGDTDRIIVKKKGTYQISVEGGGYAEGKYYDNLAGIYGSTITSTDRRGKNFISQPTGQLIHELKQTIHGGSLVGEIQLNKGDVIDVKRFRARPLACGNTILYQPLSIGCDAMMVSVNGESMIGAGGAGSVIIYGYINSPSYDSWFTSSFIPRNNFVNRIDNSQFGAGSTANSELSVSWFSGSLSKGSWKTDEYTAYSGAEKPTIPQNQEAIDRAGTNYLNTSAVTLKSQSNVGLNPSVTITCKEADVMPEDMYTASVRIAAALEKIADKFLTGLNVSVKTDNNDIVSELAKINNNLSNSGGGSASKNKTNPLTVVKGKNFSLWAVGESTSGGTVDGITVIDNDITDDYIWIKGKIDSEGLYEVVIDGKKYVFNVVEEPDSTNVKAILN